MLRTISSGRSESAVLLAPQQDIAAHRPLDPGLKAANPIEKHDRNAAACASLHQRRRKIDGAEGHDRAEHVKAEPARAPCLRLRDDEVFAVLAQARALGRDVDRVEELFHGRPPAIESSSATMIWRSRHAFAERAPACGRQRSSSEQARHLLRAIFGRRRASGGEDLAQRGGRRLGQRGAIRRRTARPTRRRVSA